MGRIPVARVFAATLVLVNVVLVVGHTRYGAQLGLPRALGSTSPTMLLSWFGGSLLLALATLDAWGRSLEDWLERQRGRAASLRAWQQGVERRSLACTLPLAELQAWSYALSLAAGLVAIAAGGWWLLPLSARFGVGLICFGFAPGFLALAWLRTLSPRPDPDDSLLDDVVAIVSLSFSGNLILNLILFAAESAFAPVAVGYLVVQLIGYLALGATWLRRGLPPAFEVQRLRLKGDPFQAGGAALLACGLGLLLLLTYGWGADPQIANPEELVVVRRVAENPSVRYDNISLQADEPSTYLFVPFQILVAGVAKVALLDVSLVRAMLWSFTTGLGVLALVGIVQVVTRRRTATLAAALLAVGLGICDTDSAIFDLGIVAPYPNRYGFAGGVLLPLNVLIFWSILQSRRVHLLQIALLIYLTIEMTFVHARETLFLLGVMAVTALVLLPSRPARRQLLRIGGIVGLTCGVLFVYKLVSMALSSSLESYVSLLARETWAALGTLRAEGLLANLFAAGPSEILIELDGPGLSMRTHVTDYMDVYLSSWTERPGSTLRLLLPLTLLGLPAYVLSARSRLELAAAGALALVGLIIISAPVKLFFSAVIGNPEVLVCFNVVYVLAFLLAAHMLGSLGSAFVRWPRWARAAALGLAAACGAGLLTPALEAIWWRPLALLLHLGVLLLVALRAFEPALRLIPLDPAPRGSLGDVCALTLALLAPGVVTAPRWSQPLWPDRPDGPYGADLSEDYPTLVEAGFLPSALPASVVRWLREEAPPAQNVLGADTLSVLVSTTHYAAIITLDGAPDVPASFIANWPYLSRHQREEGRFRLTPFVRGTDPSGLQALLRELEVDLVLVAPEESEQVHGFWERDPGLQALLRPEFAGDGHRIYSVRGE